MAENTDPFLMNDEELRQFYSNMTLQPTSREPKNAGQPFDNVMEALLTFATEGDVLGVVEMKATALKA